MPRSGLAALGIVARNRTDQTAEPVGLNDGYVLGLTLSAALLVAAILIALTVLRRTSPPSRAEQADDRDLLPGVTSNPATPSSCCTRSQRCS